MRVLVTGAAGFIGFHVSAALLARGDEVIGLDNVNAYYDPALKEHRLDAALGEPTGFELVRGDLRDTGRDRRARSAARPNASSTSPRRPACGTRSRIRTTTSTATSPARSTSSKRAGTTAPSTSSTRRRARCTARTPTMPFSVHHNVDHPVSLYAATKKATELMAHAYSHLFGDPDHRAALLHRVRAVGPSRHGAVPLHRARSSRAGRSTSSTKAACSATSPTSTTSSRASCACSTGRRRPIRLERRTRPTPRRARARTALYNIGNNQPVELLRVHRRDRGRDSAARPTLNLLPMQPGDVPATYADVDDLVRDVGFAPNTPIEVGIARFVEWYREYYGSGDRASVRGFGERLRERRVHEQRVDDVDDLQVVRDRDRDHRDQLGRVATDDRAAEHHARLPGRRGSSRSRACRR